MSLRVELIPVTPFQQNCSVIWCSDTLITAIVDPGGDLEKITAVIEKHQLQPEKILLTHGHLDHAGGAAGLARELNIPVIGPHKDDLFWLEGMEQQAQAYGFGGVETCHPQQWLVEGDEITLGNQRLKVLHCPGHTPGHVVFYHQPSELAFVGDVLFKGSIGRTDFPKGDHATLIDSIKSKLWPLGDNTRFVPGHGPISDFGEERRTNPFVGDAV